MLINHNLDSDDFDVIQSSVNPALKDILSNFHFIFIESLDLKNRIFIRKLLNQRKYDRIVAK
jgi:hypothetical protein